MSKTPEFHINEARGTVRLIITERDTWGVRRKTQHTFDRRELERALAAAEITVPWGKAN